MSESFPIAQGDRFSTFAGFKKHLDKWLRSPSSRYGRRGAIRHRTWYDAALQSGRSLRVSALLDLCFKLTPRLDSGATGKVAEYY
jgi:hypothetical protein